jgi:intracellular multiplication protein IcmM
MANEVLERIKNSKNFYRDNYHRVVRALFFSFLLILFLIIAIVFIKLTQSERGFYATSNNGGLTQIFPAIWGSRIKQPPQT